MDGIQLKWFYEIQVMPLLLKLHDKKKKKRNKKHTGSSPVERRRIESPAVSVLDDTDLLVQVAPLHTENTPQKW